MKNKTLTRNRLLLASSALVAAFGAPSLALAQASAPVAAVALSNELPADPESPDQVSQTPATQLGDIVVLGRNIPQPNRQSAEVAAFLTSEDLQRTGDSTAAAALTRVTGLSIVEGRFVYVRGLGERYSSALLNGSPLPSPEPLQRVVPLDLFPSSVLAGVTVQKSYSPTIRASSAAGSSTCAPWTPRPSPS